MPKYEPLRRIDQRTKRTQSLGFSGILNIERSTDPDALTSITEVGSALYDLKKGRRYLSTETWLAVNLTASVDQVYIFCTGALSNTIGKELILSERGVGEEVVTVVSYGGLQSDGTYMIEVERNATPLEFSQFTCRVYVRENYLRLYSDEEEPALLLFEGAEDFKALYGSLSKTPSATQDEFYSFLQWLDNEYGLVTEHVRLTGTMLSQDAEIVNNVGVRNTLSAIPLDSNAGLVAGRAPMGDGLSVLDQQGYPFVYAASVWDSGARTNLFGIRHEGSDLMLWNSDNEYIKFPAPSDHLAVVVHDTDGDYQGFIASNDALGSTADGMIIAGYHVGEVGDGEISPNAPLVLAGSAIGADAPLGFLTDVAMTTDDHYVTLAPSVPTDDGRYFTQLILGPAVVYDNDQEATSSSDTTLTDNAESTIVNLTVDASYTYPSGSQISYQVTLSEEGGRDATFTVRVYVESVLKYSQEYLFNDTIIPVSATFMTDASITENDVISLRVFYSESHQLADGRVRGTINAAAVKIQHVS